MTATKTLSELEILRLAASALNRKLREYLDKAERDYAGAYCSYDVQIEAIDDELREIYDEIEKLEKKEGGQNE